MVVATFLKEHRVLLGELVRRDIRTRYTGSLLGLFWSVLNPLLQLALYTLVFSVFLKVKLGDGASHARFAEYLFCALLPWTGLQEAWTRGTRGFLDHANLIKKTRFPLELIPLSLALSALVHQVVATAVFVPVLAWRGTLEWTFLVWLPLLLVVELLMMLGGGLLLGVLNVFVRDTAHVVGVLFMFLFWGTPIVYPKSSVPEPFLSVLELNPLTHMVDAFRYSFFGENPPEPWGIIYWAAASLLLLVLGLRLLRQTRAEVLDLV
ncbi:MAG: ABC transporter permease [Acidobacteriota bacterium]